MSVDPANESPFCTKPFVVQVLRSMNEIRQHYSKLATSGGWRKALLKFKHLSRGVNYN